MGYKYKYAVVSLLLCFVCASFWQKCTAWTDKYEESNEAVHIESMHVDERNIKIIREFYSLHWNRIEMVVSSSIEGKRINVPVRKYRDWTYIPPYFRWFYGGL